jgi:hypothetical protein
MDDRKDLMSRALDYLRRNAIAEIALVFSVLSLAGASYAAFSLPANSVGTRQLRAAAVTSRKLAKHAVTAADLDPKSIAGHIAEWAQIGANGKVTSSSPRATAMIPNPGRGIYRLSWNRSIPRNCIALANPANAVPTLGPPTADTFGPDGKSLLVETYDANGDNVPETVNVFVICP